MARSGPRLDGRTGLRYPRRGDPGEHQERRVRILFLHNNYPAQFGVLGRYLAKQGWDVTFATQAKGASSEDIRVLVYAPHREPSEGVHRFSRTWEKAVINGQAFGSLALDLRSKGYEPDVVVAHSGWGPGMYVKDVWPNAAYVGYFEWFYASPSPDVAFLADGEDTVNDKARRRSMNAPILMDLAACDVGLCPTHWQKSQFPPHLADKLIVHHDGIDTDFHAPKEVGDVALENATLPEGTPIITYVARGMEPYRGFPEFMRALERVQKERADVHAIIVGEDRIAYGKALPDGESWKQRMLAELDLDLTRTHFTGLLPRDQYVRVLQASWLHVYLTAPFVLSWSLMEAMSAGCLILASDTEPVREVLDETCGALTDMKDVDRVARDMLAALDQREALAPMREAARVRIMERYGARDHFDAKNALFASLARGVRPPR